MFLDAGELRPGFWPRFARRLRDQWLVTDSKSLGELWPGFWPRFARRLRDQLLVTDGKSLT